VGGRPTPLRSVGGGDDDVVIVARQESAAEDRREHAQQPCEHEQTDQRRLTWRSRAARRLQHMLVQADVVLRHHQMCELPLRAFAQALGRAC